VPPSSGPDEGGKPQWGSTVRNAGGIDGRNKIKFVGMLTDGGTATNESNNIRKLRRG
jgi:hypothetical protein